MKTEKHKIAMILKRKFPLPIRLLGGLSVVIGLYLIPIDISITTNAVKVVILEALVYLIQLAAPQLVTPLSTMAFWTMQAFGFFLIHTGLELILNHVPKILTPFWVKTLILIPFYIIVTYAIVATGFLTLPIDIPGV